MDFNQAVRIQAEVLQMASGYVVYRHHATRCFGLIILLPHNNTYHNYYDLNDYVNLPNRLVLNTEVLLTIQLLFAGDTPVK